MAHAISAIIPTYNRPNALQRAVESALAQTLPPTEILVCEDGKSTETQQVVKKFENPAVQWLPGPHTGSPAGPRNRGIRAAKGEWLATLDDDDVWLPDKLERQAALANKTGCLAVCTNAWRVKDGKNQGLYFGKPLKERFNFSQLLKTNLVICSSAMFHRRLFEKVRGFPEAVALAAMADYGMWLRVTTMTDFAYLSEPLLEYLDEPSVSIRKQTLTYQEQKRLVLQDFSDWAKNAHLFSYVWKVRLAELVEEIKNL